jgi:hypothetical protein
VPELGSANTALERDRPSCDQEAMVRGYGNYGPLQFGGLP